MIDIYSDKGSFLKGMLVVTNFLFSCLKFLNFEAISDDELAKIVGGGYPNNQSMNDVLHWLNGHNDGNPKQLPKWMGGLG